MNEFISRFKWVLVSAGLFLLVGIIVLVAVLASGSGNSGGGEVVANPEDTDGSPGPLIERVDSQQFDGEGGVTEDFKAGGGLTLFRFSHTGQLKNFIVTVSQDGASPVQVINVIGDSEGTKAVPLPLGDYEVEVRPEAGEWSLQIDQSVPESAPAPPADFEGSGQSATEFFALSPGPVEFFLSHEGEGVFIPSLVRSDGTRVKSIVNESGNYNSKATVEIKSAGLYLIDVLANGEWKIEVEQ